MIGAESDAGTPSGSSFLFTMLPLITASRTPAAMSVRYGSSSAADHVFVTSTTAKSVLAAALPSPGKCLTTERTPAAWRPRISASAIAATTAGSAEKLRSSAPMAGFLGFTFTSTTGARSRSMPAACIVVPIALPAARALAGSPVAPIAAWVRVAGKPFAGLSRDTFPPSWSMPMRIGPGAAARRAAVSFASCFGEAMFRWPPVIWSRSNRITPPRPAASAFVMSVVGSDLEPAETDHQQPRDLGAERGRVGRGRGRGRSRRARHRRRRWRGRRRAAAARAGCRSARGGARSRRHLDATRREAGRDRTRRHRPEQRAAGDRSLARHEPTIAGCGG